MRYADPDLKPLGFGETNDNSDTQSQQLAASSMAIERHVTNPDKPGEAGTGLTSLQRRVLQMIADGFDSGAIAEELNLSILAVDTTIGVARSRLGATSNLHAIALAMRSGAVK